MLWVETGLVTCNYIAHLLSLWPDHSCCEFFCLILFVPLTVLGCCPQSLEKWGQEGTSSIAQHLRLGLGHHTFTCILQSCPISVWSMRPLLNYFQGQAASISQSLWQNCLCLQHCSGCQGESAVVGCHPIVKFLPLLGGACPSPILNCWLILSPWFWEIFPLSLSHLSPGIEALPEQLWSQMLLRPKKQWVQWAVQQPSVHPIHPAAFWAGRVSDLISRLTGPEETEASSAFNTRGKWEPIGLPSEKEHPEGQARERNWLAEHTPWGSSHYTLYPG